MHCIIALMVATSLSGVATAASGTAILLDRHPERVVSMEIAAASREAPADAVEVTGPWRIVHTVSGVRTWEAALPVRPRTLFFHRPPSGMRLERVSSQGKPKKVKPASGLESADKLHTWSFTSDSIQVRRPIDAGAPGPEEYSLRYQKAASRELGFNREMSDTDLSEFVFRSVQVGDTSRHGLHLPAPSVIQYQVTVPENGMLRFDASIIPPEMAIPGVTSDGADLWIKVGAEADTVVLDQIAVTDTLETHRIDLSQYSGQSILLTLQTSPLATTDLDYVFIAEPTLYSADPEAPQAVLIFIDTLRADALGMYGYERDTSPKLDEWANDAAVFTQARSVAPWTLPSARTMVTGTHPERWDRLDRIQDRLAKTGWATGMMAGNVYLSSNFEMAEGWGTHRCINWPQGSMQIRRGEDFLAAHDDQPTFLLLHLMDMHLPYTEPLQYRSMFAGDTPKGFANTGYFLRNEVTRVVRSEGQAAKDYVRGRYDNNLRYLDDQLAGFLSGLKDDAVVMIVSDHGEEFWEHDGFEHGHTLYDELLRVPMLLKGPGVQPGRFESPTSLLDVAPTLASMTGVDSAGMIGEDLRGLADGSMTERFEKRPQSFGRPLYGSRRWGSLSEGIKYTVHEGKEEIYALRDDPGEHQNIISKQDPEQSRHSVGEALDRPFTQVWRMVLNKAGQGSAVRVKVKAPMAAAWVGDDPTMRGKAKVTTEDNHTVIRWPKQRGMVEVFLLPQPAMPDAVEIEIKAGSRIESHTITLVERERPEPGQPDKLLKAHLGGRTLHITTSWAPIPSDLDSAIEGFDAEVAGDLESLGYIDKGSEK